MFQWLEIEGIRYEWDGQQLQCQGPDGHLALSSPVLSNLELEDDEGGLLGYLSVEPARGQVSFVAAATPEVLLGQRILVGRGDLVESLSLATLSCTNLSSGHNPSVAAPFSHEVLSLATVLNDVETLDVFFGAHSQAAQLPHIYHEASLTTCSLQSECLPLFGDELQYL